MAKAKNIEAGLRISAGVDGLEEVGKLSAELNKTGADTEGLTAKFAELQKEFSEISNQQAIIANFKAIKREFKEADTSIAALKHQMRQLKGEMEGDGTKAQQKRYAELKSEVDRLHGRKRALGNQLKVTRADMEAAGITTNNLSKREQELAAQSDAARAKIAALGVEMQKTNARADAASAEMGRFGKGLTPISQSVMGMGKSFAAVAGVGGGLFALKDGLTAVINTTNEFTAIRSRMEYAFDGAEQAAGQMEWVKGVANELGLELKSVANGYAQLASATKNIGMNTAQTQQVFKGVAAAAASMNLSTEETNGVLLALSQIAGKGKVSMEELRGQLGERLTPAMAIAAKSMGVTTAELEKMVESGIAAEDFLPKFGAAMEEAFGGAESAGAAVNRLKNQFDELLLKIGQEGGVADAYNKIIGEVGDALAWVEEKIESLDGALTGGVSDALASTYELLKEGAAEVGEAFGGLMGIVNDIGGAFADVFGGGAEHDFSLIKTFIDGINISIGMLRDGVAGIGILFDTFAGTALTALSKLANGMAEVARILSFDWLAENYEQAAARMAASADRHFAAAGEAAMNFESKAWQAALRSAETESQRYARLEAEARTAYEKAAQAAIDAAQKAQEAQERAAQAVGTSQEQATRKAAEEAEKTAAAARRSALSAEKDWAKAFTKMGGSTEELEKLKKPLQDAGDAAKQTAKDIESIADKAKSVPPKVAEAFKAIDVDAAEVASGISTKAQEAFGKWAAASETMKNEGVEDARLIRAGFEQMMGKLQSRAEFDAFRQQLEKSGDAAQLTREQLKRLNDAAKKGAAEAKTAYEAMTQAVKAAGEAADLDRLAAQAKKAFEGGTITAAQYDQVLAQVKRRTAELEAQTAKAGDTAAAAHNKSTAEAERHRVAAQSLSHEYTVLAEEIKKAGGADLTGLSNKLKDAYESGAISGKQYESALKDLKARTDELYVSNEGAARSFNALHQGISSTYGVIKLTRDEFVRYNNLLHSMTEGNSFFLRDGWRAYSDDFLNAIRNANAAQEELNAAVAGGTVNMQHLTRATTAAGMAAGKLDDASLDKLRKSIEAARQKLVELKNEAADARQSIEAELAALNGDEEMGYALEQQKKIEELRAKQQQAARYGQNDAASEWERAIKAQEQLYARQKQQRQQQKAEEQRQAAESARSGNTNFGDVGNVDLSGLNGAARGVVAQLQSALANRDQKVATEAGRVLLEQLQNGIKRMS